MLNSVEHEKSFITSGPVLWNIAIIRVLSVPNNPKDLDPSYKMDLDFWDCLGRKKLGVITEEIR